MNPLAHEELNWSKLEAVVAGEGDHYVGKGQLEPVWCEQHMSRPDSTWMSGQWKTWLKQHAMVGINLK